MVILTLLAYGCYKEKQKEELKNKNLLGKEDGESEQLELDNIERELDQLKDDPEDFNYDFGNPESMDQADKKFKDEIKEHLEIHEENRILARPNKHIFKPSSPKSRFGAIRKSEKQVSPQRLPYKIHPYVPRQPPPFHYQPPFEPRSYPKEPRYYQGYNQRYEPYPDHRRSFNQEPPSYEYYYYNNNNSSY
eukprot:GFUD01010451.1.p1 GENE.GFUD01010451.1~~GFUD01010451.1.p1  ORF type:complete len:191 (+),score=39.12 GFUD01010451.1:394-966(+)